MDAFTYSSSTSGTKHCFFMSKGRVWASRRSLSDFLRPAPVRGVFSNSPTDGLHFPVRSCNAPPCNQGPFGGQEIKGGSTAGDKCRDYFHSQSRGSDSWRQGANRRLSKMLKAASRGQRAAAHLGAGVPALDPQLVDLGLGDVRSLHGLVQLVLLLAELSQLIHQILESGDILSVLLGLCEKHTALWALVSCSFFSSSAIMAASSRPELLQLSHKQVVAPLHHGGVLFEIIHASKRVVQLELSIL
ncbi:hypothetical protein EYF80_038435 [Liparis tanakae]|uniref:Uncharacterized protein n=1 Tax=Liparis tanakae TaxID=230148 RepID=A0A4Z2GCQ0_9TELE|nr:hypothetical protein EYF80_038435 [Liparis tanakae]